MSDATMREFWDARAREDPYYFVDNRLEYGRPDLERFWREGREALDRMLDALGVQISASDRVVEIGCGIGRITRALAERAADVRALDVSPRMLEVARKENQHLDNVEWILGDGSTLAGIASESADVCHSFVVFQHIPDPEITLGYVREMARVLRPGGWAAFQVSDAAQWHRKRPLRQRARARLLAALGRAPKGQSDAAWLGSAIDLDRLRRVSAENGLTLERMVGAGTPFCIVLVRKPRS